MKSGFGSFDNFILSLEEESSMRRGRSFQISTHLLMDRVGVSGKKMKLIHILIYSVSPPNGILFLPK